MTTYNIALGSKVPGGITVELDMSNTAAVAYLIEYGIKQSLNDAIAAVKVTDADYSADATKAIVEKKWAAILSGTVRQAGTREASDPIGAEAKKLARAWLVDKAQDQIKKAAMTNARRAGVNGTDAEVLAFVVGKMAETDHWRQAAEKSIAARKAAMAAVPEFDMGDLFPVEPASDEANLE